MGLIPLKLLQRRLEASRTGSKSHSPPGRFSVGKLPTHCSLFFGRKTSRLKQTFANLHSVMSRASVMNYRAYQNFLSINRFTA